MKQVIKITCDTKDLIAPEKLTPLQGDLKWLDGRQYEKLKASLLRHGFCFPAFVWKDGRKTYVIDAHQRVRALQKMQEEGIELDGGKIPIVYVQARNEKDAKEKIAAAMSEYGRYDEDSVYEFVKTSGFEWAEVKPFVDFPALNMGKLEKGWFDSDWKPDETIPETEGLIKKWSVKTGSAWEIKSSNGGVHIVLCGDSTTVSLNSLPKCDGVITDPPFEIDAALVRKTIARFADRAVVLSAQKQAFSLASDDWLFCMDLVWHHKTPRKFPNLTQPIYHHGNIVFMRCSDSLLGWKRPRPDFGSYIQAEYQQTLGGHTKDAALFRHMLEGFTFHQWCDPFAGAGTSLLAAEIDQKLVLAIERDPEMVAVMLERLELNGLTPHPVIRSAKDRGTRKRSSVRSNAQT